MKVIVIKKAELEMVAYPGALSVSLSGTTFTVKDANNTSHQFSKSLYSVFIVNE